MSTQHLKVGKGIKFVGVTAFPGDVEQGAVVYRSDLGTFHKFDGSGWQPLGNGSTDSANRFLSNLDTPTAINQDLLAGTDVARMLGSSSLAWKGLFSPRVTGSAITETVAFTADTSVGSNLLTNVSGSIVNLKVGSVLSGTNISANTKVVGILGTTIIMSANATGNGTGVAITATVDAVDLELATKNNLSGDSKDLNILTGRTQSAADSGQILLRTGQVESTNTTKHSGMIAIETGSMTSATTAGSSGMLNFSTGKTYGSAATGVILIKSGNPYGSGDSGGAELGTGSPSAVGGTGASGYVILSSGNSYQSSGLVAITSGGSSNGDTGEVSLKSGISSTGNSGPVILASGTAPGVTGDLDIYSGNPTDPAGSSGLINMRTGNQYAGSSLPSGVINIHTGTSDLSSSGNFELYTGSSSSANSGGINVYSGDAGTSSGAAYMYTGAAATGNSGFAGIYTGPANTASGGIELFTGVGDTSGNITVTTGNGGAASGNVVLTTGTGPSRGTIILNGLAVNVSGTKIVNVASPTNATDAATKAYVDNLANGSKWKAEVKAATTADILLDGSVTTLDTISLTDGDRVLVKDQVATEENGIYIVDAGGWLRSADADSWTELISATVFVSEGTQQDKSYNCTVDAGGTLGTDPVTWVIHGAGGANTSLSNLVTTSINQSLLPAADVTYAIGGSGLRWTQVYTNGITHNAVTSGSFNLSSGVMYWALASSADFQSRQLKDSSEVVTVDWNAKKLVDSTARALVDWSTDNVTSFNASNIRFGDGSGNYVNNLYKHSISLAANISSPTAIASLTFLKTAISAVTIDFVITEATSGKRRVGRLIVTHDGTNAAISEAMSETAIVGNTNGLSFSAGISGSNLEVRYTDTHASNACTMRAHVTSFVV